MEKTQLAPEAHKPDPAIQSQIDQLAHMQLVLQDTLQKQISLIQTHLYLVNATSLDRLLPPPPFQAAVPAYSPSTCMHTATYAVPDATAPPPLVAQSPIQPQGPLLAATPAPGAQPQAAYASPHGQSTAPFGASAGAGSPSQRPTHVPEPPCTHRGSTTLRAASSSASETGSVSPPPVRRISLGPLAKFPTPIAPREVQESKYRCEHCSRAYTLQRSLIQHLKIHMDKCPYQCADCGRRFSRKGHVDAHVRTHTQEKPYACRMCPKSFNQKSGLARHMRSHGQARIRRYRPVPL